MKFEDWQKAWQCHQPRAIATINADALLKEIRLEQRMYQMSYFWSDMFIVLVDAFLVPYFLYFGMRQHNWGLLVMAFACLFIGVFILVDRWLQRRQQPVTTDPVTACIRSSLALVRHQVWRAKNIFWWYLLPMLIGFAAPAVAPLCDWLTGHQSREMALVAFFGFGSVALIGWLICGFVHWGNRRSLKKVLLPRLGQLEEVQASRLKELEELQANLDENPSVSSGLKSQEISKMKKAFLLAFLACLLVFAAVAVLVVRDIWKTMPGRHSAPATNIEAICQEHKVPALAVIVLKDGQICERAVAGVRKLGDPALATTNDVFHIGSCTKSMTATLAAMFIEQGKLRWDTTIAEIFPELKGKMDKGYEAVTVEQLLHHRGGVPGAPPSAAWTRAWQEIGTPTEQRREFIEAVLREPPVAAPGEKEIYSNQGYTIVGAMLEKISGQNFESLMTERLFKPLHMDTAGFGAPGTPDKVDQPWGHHRQWFKTVPVQLDNPPVYSPCARVHCSLDDLARYAMFHLQENATNGLLKPETMARLHQPDGKNAGSPTENYACGWVVLNRGWAGSSGRTLYHNGSNTFFYIVMWLAPEKNFCVIAATNTGSDEADPACDEAATAMIYKWLPK